MNVKINSVLPLAYGVRRVQYTYEDRRFPGKWHQAVCRIHGSTNIVTFFSSGVEYTMSADEAAPILAQVA